MQALNKRIEELQMENGHLETRIEKVKLAREDALHSITM